MKIRTLIVDDESLARERLRKLLQEDADIDLIGECTDGRAAVTKINKEAPHLVFLDVQMPELDGFGVLTELKEATRPVIVFVTAHDKFALRAFEVHAIDYLLKPFDKERFQIALRRATDHIRRRQTGELNERLSMLLADLKPETKGTDRLAVKSGGRVILLKTEDIDWVEAADNYVNLHVGAESYLLRETMAGLEGRLDPARFLRISRSTIVNVDRVRELEPMFHGEYVVTLKDATKLTLSRGYRDCLPRLGWS